MHYEFTFDQLSECNFNIGNVKFTITWLTRADTNYIIGRAAYLYE